VDFQAFYKELKQGKPRRVYLFEGEEEYAKESALKDLRAALLLGPMAMMNDSTIENPTDSQLIAMCETLPVMSEKRLVVVKESQQLAGKAKAAREEDQEEREAPEKETETGAKTGNELIPYLDRLPDTLCLVFFVRGKADGSRRLYKKIKQLGGIVSFDPLNQQQLIQWIAKEAREYDKKIDRQTAEQLIFACGNELLLLKGEIAKLAALAGSRTSITREDISAIASFSVEYKVFDLSDKVAQGRSKEALPLMQEMLSSGEQRLMLLALLQRHFRQLLICHAMNGQGETQQAIAAALGVPGFVVRKLCQTARTYLFEDLKKAYLACIEQEFLVKSGQLPEEGSLEALVLRLLYIQNTAGGRGCG
jgi:DNA polymerase-3 subunit delta